MILFIKSHEISNNWLHIAHTVREREIKLKIKLASNIVSNLTHCWLQYLTASNIEVNHLKMIKRLNKNIKCEK